MFFAKESLAQNHEFHCAMTGGGDTESSGFYDDCLDPNPINDFGNQYYIPDENSPILDLNIRVHVMWHAGQEQNGVFNFQENNSDHELHIEKMFQDAEDKIFASSGAQESCGWITVGNENLLNYTNAPLMIDSRIRLNLIDIHFHEDSIGVINNGGACDNYLYDNYVANSSVWFDDLNIFIIELPGDLGGCGEGFNGEDTNYATIINSYSRYVEDVAEFGFPKPWGEGPNIAHEVGHCLGLHHTCLTSQVNLFEFLCDTTCQLAPHNHGVNHNMVDGGSIQKYNSPLQSAHMRRNLLTTWRKKQLSQYPIETAVIEISEPTQWDEDITWYGNIEIKAGGELTITNSTLRMQDDHVIFVQRGGKLIIDSGTITSCTEVKWRGVIVEGARDDKFNPTLVQGQLDDPFGPTNINYAGTVILINGGTIDNAVNGISSWNRHKDYSEWNNFHGGLIYCDSAFFTNCIRAVEFTPFGTPQLLDKSSFNNTEFSDLSRGVSNWASDGVTFTECYFKNIAEYGVYSHNAAVNIYNGNVFSNIERGVDLVATKVNEMFSQIGWQGTIPNDFQSGTYGVYAYTVNNLEPTLITNNIFKTTVGVFADGPNQMRCEGNDFEGTGQAFFAIDTDDNTIQVFNNHFLNKGIAITALFNNAFTTFTNNTMDQSNEFDIWVYGTSSIPGKVNISQGDAGFGASNCFSKGSIPEIIADPATTIIFDYFVESTDVLSREYPALNGNFNIISSESSLNEDCESGIEGGVPPTIVEVCTPSNSINSLQIEIQDLDLEIQQLKSIGGSLNTINVRERCLSLSLNTLARLYSGNLDYNSSNIYFAARPEFSKRIIPYSNRIQNEEYVAARQYLNSMATSNLDEIDFKATQNIYLNYLQAENYELPTADSLHLTNTGINPNPLNGYARSVYRVITGQNMQIPLPATPRSKRQEVLNQITVGKIQMYPNPTENQFISFSGLPSDEEQCVSITDINGHELWNQNLLGNEQIYVPIQTDGVYIVTIRSSSDIIFQEKLIFLTK